MPARNGSLTSRLPAVAVGRWARAQALVPVAAGWVLLASLVDGDRLPLPWDLVAAMVQSWPLVAHHAPPTLTGALAGTAVGVGLGALLGVGAALIGASTSARALLACLEAMPFVLLGPVLGLTFSLSTSRVLLAAASTMFVSTAAVMAAADRNRECEVVLNRVTGARRGRAFWYLEVPHLVTAVLDASRVAVPAGLLGALVADFLGSDRGLGVLVVNYQSSSRILLTWTVVGYCVLFVLSVVGVLGLLRRRLPTVSLTIDPVGPTEGRRDTRPARVRPRAVLLSIGVLLVVWAVVTLPIADSLVVRSPVDVMQAVVADGELRLNVIDAASTTVIRVLIGIAAVLLIASATAVMSAAVPTIRHSVLLVASAARATPLLLLVPLAVALVGRGVALETTVVVMTTFLPVHLVFLRELDGVPSALHDLARVGGGSRIRRLLFLVAPSCAEGLRDGVRITGPFAVSGAVFAEWLATGDGLGALLATSAAQLRFDELWAATFVVLIAGLLIVATTSALARPGSPVLELPRR